MGVLGLSRAVVAKRGFGDSGTVLVYDPTVERVGVLLGGLDVGCVPVPVSGADVCQVLSELLHVGSVHTIHLLGHGAPGGIHFEDVFINGSLWTELARGTGLDRSSSTIQTINFWSCETGRGEIGMKFLKQVADTTGATVHGSDQKVGSSDHGGSWELNQIASPRAPFSPRSIEQFDGVLAKIGVEQVLDYEVLTAKVWGSADSTLRLVVDGNGQLVSAEGVFRTHSFGTLRPFEDPGLMAEIQSGVVDLALTKNGVVFLKDDGSIVTFGTEAFESVDVSGFQSVGQLVSDFRSVALLSDAGEILGAVGGYYDQVSDSGVAAVVGQVVEKLIPAAANEENGFVGLKPDGTLLMIGDAWDPVSGNSNTSSAEFVAAVESGATFDDILEYYEGGYVAIQDDGTFHVIRKQGGSGEESWSWKPTVPLNEITQVEVAMEDIVILKDDGSIEVAGWLDNQPGADGPHRWQPIVDGWLDGSYPVTQLVSTQWPNGDNGAFYALREDGSVVALGWNGDGNFGVTVNHSSPLVTIRS